MMSIVKEPTSINQILTANKTLTKLINKTSSLQNLTQLFQNILDNDLSKHCQIAQKNKNTLTIIVNNAAWATNLRYAIPDILKLLRTQPEFKNIQDIRYRIKSHSEMPEPPPPPPKNPIAIQNARILKEFAAQQGKTK